MRPVRAVLVSAEEREDREDAYHEAQGQPAEPWLQAQASWRAWKGNTGMLKKRTWGHRWPRSRQESEAGTSVQPKKSETKQMNRSPCPQAARAQESRLGGALMSAAPSHTLCGRRGRPLEGGARLSDCSRAAGGACPLCGAPGVPGLGITRHMPFP